MKKVSSVVWQFFDRLEENKRCVAVLCKLCDNEYKYFGNTTNLRAHLIKKHPIQWELRQENWDGQKSLDESNIRLYEDDESTNQSNVSPKRRKYTRVHKDKNVDINHKDEEDEHEENEATHNLVRQMHNQATDEEWLEEDYQNLTEVYDSNQKRMFKKVKRELITPPRQRQSNFIIRSASTSNPEHIIIDDSFKKDEYSVFGEYIANKLRKFKAPRTRGNIQQLITTILWQAEYGMYDDAEAVKRVLMCNIDEVPEHSVSHEHETDPQVDAMMRRKLEHSQDAEAEGVDVM